MKKPKAVVAKNIARISNLMFLSTCSGCH